MANTNDFQTFATGVGADVLSPAAWAALSARTSGFTEGIASPTQCNTAWRQASFVAAALAQLTADNGPGNVQDNANLPAFELQLLRSEEHTSELQSREN